MKPYYMSLIAIAILAASITCGTLLPSVRSTVDMAQATSWHPTCDQHHDGDVFSVATTPDKLDQSVEFCTNAGGSWHWARLPLDGSAR